MDQDSKNWLERAKRDSGEKIKMSAAFTGLISKDSLEDPLVALQLGYAILLGKPIILIVDPSVELPKSLVRAVDQIERIDFSLKGPEEMERVQKAIKEFLMGLNL